MLMEKIDNLLGRRINDIVGDMQDIRDEGLHSLNELKVEYQANFKKNLKFWGADIESSPNMQKKQMVGAVMFSLKLHFWMKKL